MHQKDQALERAMLSLGLVKLVPESKVGVTDFGVDEAEGEEVESGETEGKEEDPKANFEYLLSMQMRSMTARKLAEIKKELEKIQGLLDDYEASDEATLWERDLQAFEEAHEKHEQTLADRDLHEEKQRKRGGGGKKSKPKGKKVDDGADDEVEEE
jgi:hypothetical protein